MLPTSLSVILSLSCFAIAILLLILREIHNGAKIRAKFKKIDYTPAPLEQYKIDFPALMKQSLWRPVQHWRAVLKTFWPLILVYILYSLQDIILIMIMAAAFKVKFGAQTSMFQIFLPYIPVIVISILVLISVSILTLLFSGIVNWHRTLILNEEHKRSSFWPDRRGWRYLFYAALYLLAAFALPLLFFAYMSEVHKGFLKSLTDPDGPIVFFASLSVLFHVLVFSLGFLIFAILLRYLVLLLPKIAIEKRDFIADKKILQAFTKGYRWPTYLFLICLVPLIFYAIGSIILSAIVSGIFWGFEANIKFLKLYWVVADQVIFSTFELYGALAFATFISLYYRDYVRPELVKYNELIREE